MAELFIVGGDAQERERWASALRQARHGCTAFPDGASASRALPAQKPDMIITWLFMQPMDGTELLRDLRREANRIPTLVVRDDDSEGAAPLYEMATLLGALAVVPGSLGDTEIQTTVSALLEVLSVGTPGPEKLAGPGTLFAPAGRAREEDLLRQSESLRGDDLLRAVLGSIQSLLLVVNEQRQVVFANEHALKVTGLSEADVRGLRPGEMVGCIHGHETPGGCGTTEACRTCGAVQAILSALRGEDDVREARLTLESGASLDLRVSARPLDLLGERLVVLSLDDIAAEKRRRVLERVFFHDVLNTAGGVQGLAALAKDSDEDQRSDLIELLSRTASQLVREINSQRLLSAVESNEYTAELAPCLIRDAIEDVVAATLALAGDRGVEVRMADGLPEGSLVTDGVLLGRVLGNLTKNAVEASTPGQTVTVAAVGTDRRVTFTVHNPAVIPREVQLQLFQRSYSTKGADRGLGTYSAKLFTERYLKGTVTVESSTESGTVFAVTIPSATSERVPVGSQEEASQT